MKTIEMTAGWLPGEPVIGTLEISVFHGKEIMSVSLNHDWLSSDAGGLFLDPNLQPYSGRQYPAQEMQTFGFLSDVSPDRWGRRLIQKQERINAEEERRPVRTLNPSDYLLRVSDSLRTGGIRFRNHTTGVYYSESDQSIPPVAKLRQLEQAAQGFELSSEEEERKWLSQLLVPGSSLGGARPKANVKNIDGSLWIAKFPSRNDTCDIAAWEMVEHDLAAACGITVPEAKLMRFSECGHTYLSKRFDRLDDGSRIHMMSAMTALGMEDGHTDGASYLDIAEKMEEICAHPGKDLSELWKRMAFSILTSNHDDHLRNHAFLLDSDGWALSPAYDQNPVNYADSLSLNITPDSSLRKIQDAVTVSGYFRISEEHAAEIISGMQDVINNSWHRIASKYGISEKEQKDMSPAFEECRVNI